MRLPNAYIRKWNKITDEETEALDAWWRGDLWFPISTYLRGYRKTLSKADRRGLAVLDDLTTRWPIGTPGRVYRAARTPLLRVGETFRDLNFMSVALHFVFAASVFTDPGHTWRHSTAKTGFTVPTVFTLLLPAHQTAACTVCVVGGFEEGEAEILLPRGIVWDIRQVTRSHTRKQTLVTATPQPH